MVRFTIYAEIIQQEKLVDNARENGKYLLGKLRTMESNFENKVSNSRGKGLFCAFDLDSSSSRDKLISNMEKEGAIILGCGHKSVRFRPHLNISKEDIDIACDMLDNSLKNITLSETKGVLYLVSTPIGNLGDITYRAINILNDVSLIAAEDTRYSKLLNHYNIQTKMISYYEHNRDNRIPYLISSLSNGQNIAVITDAGTPGISDPAYKLIRESINIGAKIESIPGASAFLAALTHLACLQIVFYLKDFCPQKKVEIKDYQK